MYLEKRNNLKTVNTKNLYSKPVLYANEAGDTNPVVGEMINLRLNFLSTNWKNIFPLIKKILT